MRNRRADEERTPYYVDRFSAWMWLGVMALVFASLLDACLTVRLLFGGGEEMNPVMDMLLRHSIEAFVAGKYVLTVVGLPVLLIFKNHRMFGTPIRVGHLFPICLALYAVLLCYQIALVQSAGGFF